MRLETRSTSASELVVAWVLFLVPIGAGAQTIHTITDLGTLGGEGSRALGISNAGHVVGWAETGDVRAARHGFIWFDGALTDLGHLGGLRSEALAVNSRGHVVGWSDTASWDPHGFLWLPQPAFGLSAGLIDLGTIGGYESWAFDINEQSQVIGVTDDTTFLWLPVPAYGLPTGTNDICPRYGHCFCTYAGGTPHINDAGEIVAGESVWLPAPNYDLSAGWTSLFWFGCAFDAFVVFQDINNDGLTILRHDSLVGGSSATFRLGGTYERDVWTCYNDCGLNNAGQVVSWSELSWQTDDGTVLRQNLNDSILAPAGWTNLRGTDINDLGQIVGAGINPQGQPHAFLMTPVDADFDDDTDTDLLDFKEWVRCMSGPESPKKSGCQTRDLDLDGDIDLVDFRGLQWLFTGPRSE